MNIIKKYKNDTYSFDSENHYHTVNGLPLMGVTTVLNKTLAKEALIPWAVKMAVEHLKENINDFIGATNAWKTKRDNSADVGTLIHKEIEDYYREGKTPTNERALKATSYIDKFALQHACKVKEVEMSVWSKKLAVGGIIDLVFVAHDGSVILGDIKTSSGIYESHWFQLGAYAGLIGSSSDYGDVKGLVIFNFPSQKETHKIEYKDNVEYYKNAFLKILEVYKIIK